MTDIIQREIDYLELANKYGIPVNWVIKSGEKIATMFEKISHLEDMFSQLKDWVHLNGEEIKPLEITTVWGAMNSSNKSLLKDLNQLYQRAREYVDVEEDAYYGMIKDVRLIYENRGKQKSDKEITKLVRFRDFLKKINGVDGFDFVVEETVLLLPSDLTPGHDISLFDNIKTSDYLPFVSINLDSVKTDKKGVKVSSNRKFKMYNNPSRSLKFPLEWIHSTNVPESIQMKLLVKKENIDNKSAYSTVEYLFGTNQFLIHFPVEKTEEQSRIIERFTSRVEGVEFSKPIEYQIFGSFVVRNMPIDNKIMIDLIMTNKILREFMYVDESQNTFAQKKRLTIHFKIGLEHVSITLSVRKSKTSEMFFENGHGIRLPQNETYLHVQINQSPNREFASWTVEVVKKLLTHYLNVYQEIGKVYKKVIPTFKYLVIKEKDREEKELVLDDSMSKLKKLKLADPDAFITKYATKCQRPTQPLVILESQIDYWRRKGRQVIKYPSHISNPEAKQFNYRIQNYYVSDNESTPYLGLMNNTLDNAKNYPYLICSYKEKHLEVDENWNIKIIKLGDDDETESRTNNDYVLDANKLLGPGRRGFLKPKLAYFFGKDSFTRIGVEKSPDSLLDCILLALNRENTKQEIAETFLDVAKQEAYDMSTFELKSLLLSGDFVDPAIFYRIFEDFFQINIFTFSGEEIQVPRHKFFHIRDYSLNDRPVVLIYNEGDQCELIVNKDDYTFGKEMLEKCQTLMKQSSRVTSLQIDQAFTETIFFEHPTIGSTVNEAIIPRFEWTLTGQHVDGAGKVRGLLYEKGKERVFFYTTILPVGNISLVDVLVTKERDAKNFCHDNGCEYLDGTFVKDGIAYRFEMEEIKMDSTQIVKVANVMKDVVQILTLWGNVEYEIDTKVKYNVSKVVRRVPQFVSREEAFSYFEKKIPTMVRNGKVIVQSERHKEGLEHFVKLNKGRMLGYLPRFYENVSDFVKRPYEMLFFNIENLALSMIYMHPDNSIKKQLVYSTEPFLLQQGRNFYLVQNVENASRERAVSVVYNWYHNLVNPGFYATPLQYDYAVREIEYNEAVEIPDKAIARFQNGFCAILRLDIEISEKI